MMSIHTLSSTNIDYYTQGSNVIFPGNESVERMIMHVSFVNRFRGKSVVAAKQMMKRQFTSKQKSVIIRYLKDIGAIREL